jgi:hypothetical protein
MQQNPFDRFDAQPRPTTAQQTPPSIQIKPADRPDPLELRRDARAEAADARAAAREERAIQSQESQSRATMMTATGSLRDDYNRDPAVSSYLKAVPSYAAALQSDNTPQGDLNLIYAFAKVMDPDSVVREGEQAAVASSDTIAGRYIAQLRKQLDGSGTFSPEALAGLR